jgi:hypothetical protein
MRKTIRSGFSLAAVAALIGVSCGAHIACAAVHTADSPPGDIAAGAWQHHKVSFNYVGFTALYTCEGLEDQVRQILLYLGARKDVHVSARGCPGPSNTPSRNAYVDADFYTLAPVAGAGASDTVKTRWTAFELTPRHPGFMGNGDCELMQSMKDLITKNFSLRDLEYRTDCYPNVVNLDSFAVKAQALRALPQTSTASRIAPVASPY